MKTKHAHARSERLRIGADHAAFAGRQVLDRVQGKDDGAASADRLRVVLGARRVGRVLDERHAAAAREGSQRLEVERRAGEMHGNDELGSLGERLFGTVGVRHQGVSVDVDEHWRCPAEADEIDGGHPRHRRRDDLVAGTDAELM